jgi:hypothetical protein
MRTQHLLVAALLVFAFDCGGCASKPTAKAKDDGEWVTLPPATGSFLPRRVQKSDLNNLNPASTNNLVTVSSTNFTNSAPLVPKAGGPPPGASGN